MMRSSEPVAERSQCASWRRYWRRIAAACLVGYAATNWSGGALLAATPVESKASTSRADKEDAIENIPFDKLKSDVSKKLSGIVEKPSIFRRLPSKTIACDPDMYLFLVRYPEVVVNIWEIMGVTNVKLKRVGEYTFECSDGAGTVGTVELVYGTQNLHILYCEASYEGTLTGRKLHGRGVMVLKSEYKKDASDQMLVENRLDVFIQLDQVGADLLAKTLQPLVGKSADVNFHESATFVGRVSQAAEANGPGIQRLAAKLNNVAPEVRDQFADVAIQVNERAILRQIEEGKLQLPEERATSKPIAAPVKGKPQLRR